MIIFTLTMSTTPLPFSPQKMTFFFSDPWIAMVQQILLVLFLLGGRVGGEGVVEFITTLKVLVNIISSFEQDGYTYEKSAIVEWFGTHDSSPCTSSVLPSKVVLPNLALRALIVHFLETFDAMVPSAPLNLLSFLGASLPFYMWICLVFFLVCQRTRFRRQ